VQIAKVQWVLPGMSISEDRLGCEFTKQLTTYLQPAAAPIRSRSTSDATYQRMLEALATV
jgi:hypothetical protein